MHQHSARCGLAAVHTSTLVVCSFFFVSFFLWGVSFVLFALVCVLCVLFVTIRGVFSVQQATQNGACERLCPWFALAWSRPGIVVLCSEQGAAKHFFDLRAFLCLVHSSFISLLRCLGERSQDPPHFLRGQEVPQAHQAQGDSVQGWKGFWLRSGCVAFVLCGCLDGGCLFSGICRDVCAPRTL